MSAPESFQQAIVKLAADIDWNNCLNQGAGSCVSSWPCAGVTQEDLLAFARAVAKWQAERDAESIAARALMIENANTHRGKLGSCASWLVGILDECAKAIRDEAAKLVTGKENP